MALANIVALSSDSWVQNDDVAIDFMEGQRSTTWDQQKLLSVAQKYLSTLEADPDVVSADNHKDLRDYIDCLAVKSNAPEVEYSTVLTIR